MLSSRMLAGPTPMGHETTTPQRTQAMSQVIPDAAYLSTAFIGKCERCDDRSEYGLSIDAAEDWVTIHNTAHERLTK